MTIYDQISSNKRKTYVIMIGFVVFISLLGYIIGEFWAGYGYGIPILIFALLISLISAVSGYYFSDKMVLKISGAKKVGRKEVPGVYGILDNLCVGAGLKKVPDLYIINDTAPNAFATGRDPNHAVVAITSGLANKLNKREMEGVLAHELSHIRNYDIRLMTIVVVLVGIVTMIANVLLRGGFRSGDSKKAGGALFIVGLVLIIFSPIIANLIKLAVSRSREYLADASGALLTRDPEGLALALEKISADTEPLEVANEATAHMYISNPLNKGGKISKFSALFNTHPPVQERIKKLRSM